MITINGVTISGNAGSIIVNGNEVILDGKKHNLREFKGDGLNVTIVVDGNVGSINTVSADVTVNGSAQSVQSTSGDIRIKGNVSGNVGTTSGDVNVKGDVTGSVRTVSGDINN